MSYILIYWLLATSSSFSATGNVSFADQVSCQAALVEVKQTWDGPAGANGVCVPQATASVVAVTPPPAAATVVVPAPPPPTYSFFPPPTTGRVGQR